MRKGWKKAVSTMLCAAMILSMSSFIVSADGEPTIPETPAGDATTEVPGDEKDPEEQPPVNEEKDPADEEKDPADEEKDPADEEKDPADEEKDPADEEKDPADEKKDPAGEEKDPADEEKDPSEVPGGPEQPSNSLPLTPLTPAAPAAENGIMTLDLPGAGTVDSPFLVSTVDDLRSAVETGGYQVQATRSSRGRCIGTTGWRWRPSQSAKVRWRLTGQVHHHRRQGDCYQRGHRAAGDCTAEGTGGGHPAARGGVCRRDSQPGASGSGITGRCTR